MKLLIAPALFLAGSALCQAPAGIGTATTKGLCSPVATGSRNTFNLTCSGLTPSQQALLQNIPALINRLLDSQTDANAEILAKLDVCVEQGAARHISQDQKSALAAALQPFRGQSLIVAPYVAAKESSDYGDEVAEALRGAGLNVTVNTIAAMAPLPIGIQINFSEQSARISLLDALAKAFVESKMSPRPIHVIKVGGSPDLLEVVVGVKP